VAIFLWACGYFGTGKGFLSLAFERRSIVLAVFSVFWFAVGTRIALNAFPSNARNEKGQSAPSAGKPKVR
jgi:hypothetical protein